MSLDTTLMLACEKTGCQIWSPEYNEYFFGDLYAIAAEDGSSCMYVLKCRTDGRSREPVRDKLHLWANRIHFWRCGDWYIVFIMSESWFEYEGRSLPDAFK